MIARIVIIGDGAAALATDLSEMLQKRGDVVADIRAAQSMGEGPHPAEPAGPEVSTRGHRKGDRVRLDREEEPPLYGVVIDLLNGHAVVQFDGRDVPHVMIGATMDDLHVVPPDTQDADPAGEQAVPGPREVAGRDSRYDPLEAAQSMARDVDQGVVVAVSLVGITSEGGVRLYGSESIGQTLNMLAQGIKVADGTLDPEED